MTAGALARDVRVIGLVGAAHFTSHFFQLALPPLFPLLRDELGVPWVALGALMSVFYAGSGVGQTIAGFLVDRVGARRVLLAGLALLAAAIALAGATGSYAALLAIALVAGLGNAAFHPADYAILGAAVSPERLGRAYSVHGISGNLGWAAAPAVVVALAGLVGWRPALALVGGAGLALALALARRGFALDVRATGPAGRARGGAQGLAADVGLLLALPILSAFSYFALSAGALIGLQSFAVGGVLALYDVPLGLATGALTGLLLGGAAGVLAGGVLADRTQRHERVAGAGLALAALFVLLVAGALPPPALLVPVFALAGFCLGATSPSRDMLVRAATPPGAAGKVFGFAYSGLDLGSALAPVAFGWLLDRGEPRALFALAAGLMLAAIVTVVGVRRRALPATAGA